MRADGRSSIVSRRAYEDGLRWLPLVVDVDQPLADVVTGGPARLHVTAFSGGRPLGTTVVVAPLDPFPGQLLADDLRRRFAHALAWSTLEAAAPNRGEGSTTTPGLRHGVLVCTRDRPDDLARCLASIKRLARAPDEVLVVDNGTDPATRAVCAAAGVGYLREPEPGLDRARNRGFAELTTELVLCTDDDVEVDAEWAERLTGCFADPLVMAATGLVLPARLDTPAQRRFEAHAGFSRGYRPLVLDGTLVPATQAGRAGAGASMALRRDFVRAIGGFPEALDAGMATGSGGDTYVLYRVLRAGFRIVYEPSAVALHHHRRTEAALRTALRGYGTGVGAYLAHAIVQDRDPTAFTAGARWLGQHLVRQMVRSLLQRPTAPPPELALEELLGTLAAPVAYLRARRTVRRRRPVSLPSSAMPSPAWASQLGSGATTTTADAGDGTSLSVVIPTHQRRDLVLRLLRALDRQRLPASGVEVLVCVDGDLDGTATAVERADLRCSPKVLVLDRPSGAAAARNLGAATASGDVLLFLDDDVLPAHDDLLLAHLAAHAAGPAVVVGPCPPAQWAVEGRGAKAIRNWWTDQTRALLSGAPLTFTNVNSGNLSLPRSTFVELGGFAPLPRREDWELGYRLEQAGVPVRAAPAALVRHEADLDLANALADRRAEGAGDVAMARAHPSVAQLLALAHWPDLEGRRRRLVDAVLAGDRAVGCLLDLAWSWLPAVERTGLLDQHSRLRLALEQLSYWSGVAEAAGGERGLGDLLAVQPVGGRTSSAFELADPTWEPPPTGTADDVVVSVDGRTLGTAPLRWGGVPWDRSRFRQRVVHTYAESALRARARARAT